MESMGAMEESSFCSIVQKRCSYMAIVDEATGEDEG